MKQHPKQQHPKKQRPKKRKPASQNSAKQRPAKQRPNKRPAKAASAKAALSKAASGKPALGMGAAIVRILLIASGLIFLLVTIASLFYANFNTGAAMLICAEICLILYGIFFRRLAKIRWLNYTILAGCVLALAMMVSIGVYGTKDTATYQEDAVIVLGAGIRGERVGMVLARRLAKAVEYFDKNPQATIVVSGAQGFQEDITEALAMERYLVSIGIPKERIFKEEEATSTYENLLYSKAILDGFFGRPYEIAIITNEFHMYRTSKLAENLGLEATRLHSNTAWYEIPKNYMRECLGIFKYWLLGK
jgi:uncharacterized SAM-binding protein YcdF (DUF218 family)